MSTSTTQLFINSLIYLRQEDDVSFSIAAKMLTLCILINFDLFEKKFWLVGSNYIGL